jgi:predicted DNA-binding ribbon-helix-helix protein
MSFCVLTKRATWGSKMQDSKYKSEEIKTSLVSRNITIMGRRTSVRLEPEMWLALREISARECCSIHDICTLVSIRKNPRSSLTASIRVFLMLYFRASSTEDGHVKAGHGNFQQMMQRARVPDQVIAHRHVRAYNGPMMATPKTTRSLEGVL